MDEPYKRGESNLNWYYFERIDNLKKGNHKTPNKKYVLYLSRDEGKKGENIIGLFFTRKNLANLFRENPKFNEEEMENFRLENSGKFYYYSS